MSLSVHFEIFKVLTYIIIDSARFASTNVNEGGGWEITEKLIQFSPDAGWGAELNPVKLDKKSKKCAQKP